MTEALQLAGLDLLHSGKVRDIYTLPNEPGKLLFVASDRISAFDCIMKNVVPNKGKILTQLSLFWFELFSTQHGHTNNHLITADIDAMPECIRLHKAQLKGRSMLVKRLKIVPIEAIVRGYISGSGWKEYQAKGTVCDADIGQGLQESSKLAKPVFTPSTKADYGDHDENISVERAARVVGQKTIDSVASLSLQLYEIARDYAAQRGIIIADTKFEFGKDSDGQVILADEVLTPDSSRFWPAATYCAGRTQDSLDKQFVRNFLETVDEFDKSEGIALPDSVVKGTMDKYCEIFRILVGHAPDLS